MCCSKEEWPLSRDSCARPSGIGFQVPGAPLNRIRPCGPSPKTGHPVADHWKRPAKEAPRKALPMAEGRLTRPRLSQTFTPRRFMSAITDSIPFLSIVFMPLVDKVSVTYRFCDGTQ